MAKASRAAASPSRQGGEEARARRLEASRQELKAEDAVVTPGIGDAIRTFCKNGGSVEEARQLLVSGYRGYNHLAQRARQWVAMAKAHDAASSSSTRVVNGQGRATDDAPLKSFDWRRQILNHFKAERADLLLPQRAEPPWLPPLIKVKEWRSVVYELAKQRDGQASPFLNYVLHRILEAGYPEEVLWNASSTVNFYVFNEALRVRLTRFISLLGYDDFMAGSVVQEIAQFCNFSESTYVYSQAVLHHLARLRPAERWLYRCLSQALSEAAKERSESVQRLDLLFTTLAQYKELFGIFYASCQGDNEVKIVTSDVVKLCLLVERLLIINGHLTEAQLPARPKSRGSLDALPSAAAVDEDRFSDSDSDDNGSWGQSSNASAVSLGRGLLQREVQRRSSNASEASASHQGTESAVPAQEGESSVPTASRTASIFHMPAVSSRAASGVGVNKVASPSAGSGIAGVWEALQRPAILDALIQPLIDTASSAWGLRERSSLTRLLAYATTEGLWPSASDAKQAQAVAQAAAVASKTASCTLDDLHITMHHPQWPWLKKVAHMRQYQQQSPVASLVILRWTKSVVLSKNLRRAELIARMTHYILYENLRRACSLHPRQLHAVLDIVRHMLQVLGGAADVAKVDRADDAERERAAPPAVEIEHGPQERRIGKMISSLLLTLMLSHSAAVDIIELVKETAQVWDVVTLRFFTQELLAHVAAPYSERFTWSLAGLLAHASMQQVVKGSPELRQHVQQFCRDASAPWHASQQYPEETSAHKVLTDRRRQLDNLMREIENSLRSAPSAASGAEQATDGMSATSTRVQQARALDNGARGPDSGVENAAAERTQVWQELFSTGSKKRSHPQPAAEKKPRLSTTNMKAAGKMQPQQAKAKPRAAVQPAQAKGGSVSSSSSSSSSSGSSSSSSSSSTQQKPGAPKRALPKAALRAKNGSTRTSPQENEATTSRTPPNHAPASSNGDGSRGGHGRGAARQQTSLVEAVEEEEDEFDFSKHTVPAPAPQSRQSSAEDDVDMMNGSVPPVAATPLSSVSVPASQAPTGTGTKRRRPIRIV